MYANYGRDEDFAELKKLGVNCTGKIVIIRYGKVGRSSKVSVKAELPSGCNNKVIKAPENASSTANEKRRIYITSGKVFQTKMMRGILN